jgi:hypothetical protein
MHYCTFVLPTVLMNSCIVYTSWTSYVLLLGGQKILFWINPKTNMFTSILVYQPNIFKLFYWIRSIYLQFPI